MQIIFRTRQFSSSATKRVFSDGRADFMHPLKALSSSPGLTQAPRAGRPQMGATT